MKNLFAGVALALCVATASSAETSTKQQPASDLGRLSRTETVSATVALSLDTAGMERLITNLYDKQGPQFRKFLSTSEFQSRFAPSAETVRRVSADLRGEGLTVEVVNGTLLRVTGAPAQMESAFGVELHSYSVSTGVGPQAIRYHAPTGPAQLRSSWNGLVDSVVGLDTRPHLHPHKVAANPKLTRTNLRGHAASAPNTPNYPGTWTVQDFADYYDVNPLYKQGVTGKGATIGIVTYASITPADVFDYWASVGLSVNKNRLTVVNVDSGPGAPSDDSGSDETTLDVEQSGGIAPDAKVIIYQAPNTDQATVDVWANAVSANRADVLSTSWGEWEELVSGTPVSDPAHPKKTEDEVVVLHNLFMQAAIQGQSLFAAAGDSGAYDANDSEFIFPLPQYSEVLSVDHPAADSFMTAAGGTTLPGPQYFNGATPGSTITININHERAWSWSYLNGLCADLGFDPISCGIFPAGGGGGVSALFPLPDYQSWIGGMRSTEPKQVLTNISANPVEPYVALPIRVPGNYPGRNLPDISFNADPETGYSILYTSDQAGAQIELTYIGGTSFVAPQLAGVTALVDVKAGGRVGLLNYSLYALAYYQQLYSGKKPAARDITDGDNDFYKANAAYDQASGLGVLDVANFAAEFAY